MQYGSTEALQRFEDLALPAGAYSCQGAGAQPCESPPTATRTDHSSTNTNSETVVLSAAPWARVGPSARRTASAAS